MSYELFGLFVTETCFHKNNFSKLVLFLPPALEIVDQDREPSEKLGSQIH